MKKINYILTSFIVIAVSFSCTDQSTFNNPSSHELENGAFIRFVDSPEDTASDPQAISFISEVYDPVGNVTQYTVALKATVSGVVYLQDNYFTTTTFPATFSYTSQSLADAIGINVDDFTFGDNFEFTGFATRNDGVVFNGINPTFDTDKLTIGVGNTEPNLHLDNYNSAMSFGTIVACAEHIASEMPGIWTVVRDDWADYSPGDTLEVVAGPNDNTFHILANNNPFINNSATAYMIIEVDGTGNVINATSNEPFDYGIPIVPNDAAGGGGLIFSCVGVIDLRHDWLSPDQTLIYGGGNHRLILTKN